PADQMVLADMLNERVQRTVSIARGVFDLGTDLAERFAFPCHFKWSEMPARVARHAGGIEVGLQVADGTTQGREAKSISSSLNWRLVQPPHVTLTRTIAGGVAIDTAWVRQHLGQFREYRRRAGCWVADRCKAFDARKAIRRAVRNRVRSQHAHRQNHDRNEELNPQIESHPRLPPKAQSPRHRRRETIAAHVRCKLQN